MSITFSAEPQEIIRYLHLKGELSALCEEIQRSSVIRELAKESGLCVEDKELQRYADTYRIARKLHTASEMTEFLKKGGLTLDEFEAFCETSLFAAMVRENHATEERIQDWFFNNRGLLDRVRISYLKVDDEGLASEIDLQLRDDGEDFHKLAVKHSKDEATRFSGGYAGFVRRGTMKPELEFKIFSAECGDLIGPVADDGCFHFFLIEEVKKAELNEQTREFVKDRLFDELLTEKAKAHARDEA